jgi:hypothetical protein
LSEIQLTTTKGLPPVRESIVAAANIELQAPVWLAAYTTPRHEKSVVRHLEVRGVEHFLPLFKLFENGRTVAGSKLSFQSSPITCSYAWIGGNQPWC